MEVSFLRAAYVYSTLWNGSRDLKRCRDTVPVVIFINEKIVTAFCPPMVEAGGSVE